MRRAARTDRNQTEIVKALRDMGAVVLITSQLKNCFDILVYYRGSTLTVEIKDGTAPLSKQKLTEGELRFRDKIESIGIPYFIIRSKEEAINLLLSV
jgi:hypothetical protein